MSQRGVPFYDHYRPILHEVGEEMESRVFRAFGSDTFNATECSSLDVSRPAIAVRLASQGLGQNLLQLTNYIMHVGLTQSNTLFFLPYRDDSPKRHGFQVGQV
jgi:hypothetical protein